MGSLDDPDQHSMDPPMPDKPPRATVEHLTSEIRMEWHWISYLAKTAEEMEEPEAATMLRRANDLLHDALDFIDERPESE